MKDKELRRLIGSRAKQRRIELGLNQPYVNWNESTNNSYSLNISSSKSFVKSDSACSMSKGSFERMDHFHNRAL